MDIGTGAGLAGATGVRPFLPPLLAGRARARRRGHRLRRHRLELPRVARLPGRGARCWASCPTRSTARAPGRPTGARRSTSALLVARRRARRAAVRRLAGGRRPRGLARPGGGPAVRAARRAGRGRPGRARPAAPRRRRGRLLLGLRGHGGARARRRRGVRAAALVRGADRLRRCCCSAAGGARARSTRACGSSARVELVAEPKKLVLAVIDSLKPDMLDLAIEEGRAPALGRAPRARDLRARLRVDLPVGDAGGLGRDRHRRRPGRAPHPLDELVPPRRGALRRVRLVVPGHARVRGRPLALRHGLQHEHGPPEPGAARRCSSTSTTPACAPPAPPG